MCLTSEPLQLIIGNGQLSYKYVIILYDHEGDLLLEGDWGLNEGDFLTTCSGCFSYHFHMV